MTEKVSENANRKFSEKEKFMNFIKKIKKFMILFIRSNKSFYKEYKVHDFFIHVFRCKIKKSALLKEK